MIDEKLEFIVPEDILENWQEIVDILSQLCEVPAALIMKLTGTDIEVFVSSRNEGNPYHRGDKEHLEGAGLYCETVVKSRDKLLVPDALADNNWKNNPDMALNMISYLGFPIFLPDGNPFGTICILDRKQNRYSRIIENLMLRFREIIESNLELIYINQALGDKNKRLIDYLMELQAFRGMVPICAHCKAIQDQQGKWHPIENYLIRHPEADFSHGICPKCMKEFYPGINDGT